MIDEPAAAPPPPDTPIAVQETEAAQPSAFVERPDGTLVIDLLQLVPAMPALPKCEMDEPDPLSNEIVVCRTSNVAHRLGPPIGPTDEEAFGSAIPRARIKLSDTAAAEANATAPSVGGWNAQGGEVRLKIDF